MWIAGQSLMSGDGFWFSEGVSNPVPLPTQNLLNHWLLYRSHKSSFHILSGHLMLYMQLRQMLKNVLIFCSIVFVVCHVLYL
jgi:hypothetical protein